MHHSLMSARRVFPGVVVFIGGATGASCCIGVARGNAMSDSSSSSSPSSSSSSSSLRDSKKYSSANDGEKEKVEKSSSLEDCLSPACHSTMELLQKMNSKNKLNKKKKKSAEVNEITSSSLGCPVDKDQLGRSSWDLLHTIAASYPTTPSHSEKKAARDFLLALGVLYPCSFCAKDLREYLQAHPPRVDSREELSLWCCEMHNEVNKKLGKPIFKCSIKELDLRWKDGRDECWDPSNVHSR